MTVMNFGEKKIMGMNYTRYIAIPKDWLRDKGLDANDKIKIELTESGDLLLKAVRKEEG